MCHTLWNTVISSNFHTRKLGEISLYYAGAKICCEGLPLRDILLRYYMVELQHFGSKLLSRLKLQKSGKHLRERRAAWFNKNYCSLEIDSRTKTFHCIKYRIFT